MNQPDNPVPQRTRTPVHAWLPARPALTVLGLAVAFAAGTWLSAPRPAEAQQAPGYGNQGSAAQNNRMIAVSGSVGSGMSVLWLVDTETRRVVVYGTNNLGKNIELRAARNIEWDLRLDEYNDDSQYKAEDLRRLAERRRQSAPTRDAGGAGEDGR